MTNEQYKKRKIISSKQTRALSIITDKIKKTAPINMNNRFGILEVN